MPLTKVVWSQFTMQVFGVQSVSTLIWWKWRVVWDPTWYCSVFFRKCYCATDSTGATDRQQTSDRIMYPKRWAKNSWKFGNNNFF